MARRGRLATRYRPLGRAFFDRPAVEVARDLLGALLVCELDGLCAGRIVEVEAYPGPDDPGSHAWERIGRTARNDPMFGPPGTAYLHLNYGVHWCLNAVTGPAGFPAAVLVRAVEPVEGLDRMRERRGGRPEGELTSGPGRLAQALGIGPDLQRHPLHRPPLYIAEGERVPASRVARGPRVGITRGAELPLRFSIRNSPWVSR